MEWGGVEWSGTQRSYERVGSESKNEKPVKSLPVKQTERPQERTNRKGLEARCSGPTSPPPTKWNPLLFSLLSNK